ncbi:MAG: hypothetical protein M1348_02415 [Candidatus Parvarchaeota archaeon]|jgi:hypothetical protein|nr:hypothetical protein [Candidatus Parvarchaeota archaeon]
MTPARQTSSTILGIIPIIIIVIVILYSFSHNFLIIDTCPGSHVLIVTSTARQCFPSFNQTVIVNGTPYTLNSSFAISDGSVIPLDFRFLGENPLLYIWNQNKSENPGSYVFLTIPDTFKMHMQYVSNVSTEFIIMNSSQYVRWVNSRGTNFKYVSSYSGRTISTWFNESAGCAGYVAIIKAVSNSAFFIAPNETALYDPAPNATGACA